MLAIEETEAPRRRILGHLISLEPADDQLLATHTLVFWQQTPRQRADIFDLVTCCGCRKAAQGEPIVAKYSTKHIVMRAQAFDMSVRSPMLGWVGLSWVRVGFGSSHQRAIMQPDF